MNRKITDSTLANLASLADQATPGPWHRSHSSVHHAHRQSIRNGHVIALTCDVPGIGFNPKNANANARHIAACDPRTIKALVAEVQAFRASKAKQ